MTGGRIDDDKSLIQNTIKILESWDKKNKVNRRNGMQTR